MTASSRAVPLVVLALSCARSAPPKPVVAAAAPAPAASTASSRPVLSPPGTPASLPIRDPLLRPDLAVEATAQGAGGKTAALWLDVNSGAPGVILPPTLLAGIGLSGKDEARLGLGLGAISVSGLSVAALSQSSAAPERGVLGHPVLRETTWEISWNGGTLTLEAKPWPAAGAVRVAPLAPLGTGDGVEVKINGRPVRMLFDTGSIPSMLPESLVASHGLETAAYEGTPGDGPETAAARVIIADAEIGGVRFVRHRFLQGRAGDTPVLGLDLLARFDIQVVPGRGLYLKPRDGDLRASAAQRIRRWAWMPACKAVGCARGRVVGTGKQSRVEIDFDAKLPRPLQFLMGCAERREPEEPAPWMDWTAPPATRGQHLVIDAKETVPRKAKVAAPGLNLSLVLPNGAACRKLAVLDVAPISPANPSMPELTAMVVP